MRHLWLPLMSTVRLLYFMVYMGWYGSGQGHLRHLKNFLCSFKLLEISTFRYLWFHWLSPFLGILCDNYKKLDYLFKKIGKWTWYIWNGGTLNFSNIFGFFKLFMCTHFISPQSVLLHKTLIINLEKSQNWRKKKLTTEGLFLPLTTLMQQVLWLKSYYSPAI